MTKKGQSEVYCVLFIIGLDEVVVLSELVMFPPIVAFVPPVMLVSGVLTFCAFAEFRPTIAIMPIMAARIGMIKTNFVLIVSSPTLYLIMVGYNIV